MSILSVLMLVTVLSLLASTMAGVYLMNLNFAQTHQNAALALQEADAAVGRLTTALVQNLDLNLTDWTYQGTLGKADPDPEVWAAISFGDRTIGGVHLPRSINNFGGSASDHETPPGKCRVYAVGYCRGVIQTVEVLLSAPPYPYGLAVAGNLESEALTIRGTADGDDSPRPGHLATRRKLTLGANSYISGDVYAREADISPSNCTILGARRLSETPRELPLLDIDELFGKVTGHAVKIDVPAMFNPQVLNTLYTWGTPGNNADTLRLETSSIHFDNGILRVYGSVSIDAVTLSGKGAILCTGNLTIDSQTDLDGRDDWLALVAGGKITLRSGNHTQIRGIVYAQQGLEAEKVLVNGSAICNSASDPDQAAAKLTNCEFASDPTTANVTLTVQISGDASGNGGIERTNGSGQAPFSLSRNAQGLASVSGGGTVESGEIMASGMDRFVNSNGPPFSIPANALTGNGPAADAVLDQFKTLGTLSQSLDSARQALAAAEAALAAAQAADDDDDDGNSGQVEAARQAVEAAQAAVDAQLEAFNQQASAAQSAYQNYVQTTTGSSSSVSSGGGGGGSGPPAPPLKLNFDINAFLPKSESYRISYYRIHKGLP
ncbi:MAG: hypothetical protein KF760_23905 [Candidatus Eremiobacteraeota bacterium]|nr:hypothetical protein [Candidatus Eremiobacteraeota bacterium]MCW5866602.1 hypothetical protein [Candidatus Eremiobacteraeota bacterium]